MATAAPTEALLERLGSTRRRSEEMVAGLEPEDLGLQGMADASPPKWHLGHTTWFFETFLLRPHLPGYTPADSRWGYLFNSYYDAIGARHPRPERGLLSRPVIAEVIAWRRRVDAGLTALLERLGKESGPEAEPLLELLELGLQHEQQHQELLLMDLLDGFSRNPLEPAAWAGGAGPEAGYGPSQVAGPLRWLAGPAGLVEIGHPANGGGFHFDNEAPRHRVWLEPYAIANRLVRNGDYATFIADGGYQRPELWLSEGWAAALAEGWQAPRLLAWQRACLRLGVGIQPGRPPPLHPEASRSPSQLVRSRRLCPLGRCPAAQRGRVGGRCLCRSAPGRGRWLWRADRRSGWAALAVDGQSLPPLPGLPASGRCRGRIQRQVHELPDGAARRQFPDAGAACAPHLPQLLSAGQPLDGQRPSPG